MNGFEKLFASMATAFLMRLASKYAGENALTIRGTETKTGARFVLLVQQIDKDDEA